MDLPCKAMLFSRLLLLGFQNVLSPSFNSHAALLTDCIWLQAHSRQLEKTKASHQQALAAVSQKLTKAAAEAAAHHEMASQLQQQCEKLQAQLQQAAQTQSPAAIKTVSTDQSAAEPEGLRPTSPTCLVQSTKSYAPQTPAPLQAVLPTLSAIITADPEHPHARWLRHRDEVMPHAGISCLAADDMLALANSEAAPRITTVFQSGQLRASTHGLTSCLSI